MRVPAATGMTCAARNVGPKIAIGIAARRLGSGSQTSNAARGTSSGGVWKLHRALLTRPWPSTRLRATPK